MTPHRRPENQDIALSSIHGLSSGPRRFHCSAARFDRTVPQWTAVVWSEEKEIVMRKASDRMTRIGGAGSAWALFGAAPGAPGGGPGAEEATAKQQSAVVPASNGPGQAPEIPPATIPRF